MEYPDGSMGDGLASNYGSVNKSRAPVGTQGLASGRSTPAININRGSSEESYEELLRGSMPCPSCRGLGRVPRDQESELVALIPMKDKRLKPRRTLLYVLLAIVVCLVIAGLLLFFLFPRNVIMSSNHPPLLPIFLDLNISASFVNLTVMNVFNITNNNFYSIRLIGAQMTAMYEDRTMATGLNTTTLDVPIKSEGSYGVLMNFVWSKANGFGFLVAFCEDSRPWVHSLLVTFELMANYTYFGHQEQASLKTYQQVSCYNSSLYSQKN